MGPVLNTDRPTAQTSLLDSAETANRLLEALATCGLETIVHDVPSQCSVRLCLGLLLSALENPTAHALVGLIVMTDSCTLSPAPASGVDTIVHELPSQRAASV